MPMNQLTPFSGSGRKSTGGSDANINNAFRSVDVTFKVPARITARQIHQICAHHEQRPGTRSTRR